MKNTPTLTEHLHLPQEIDLVGLIFELIDHWKFVVSTTLICLLISVGYLRLSTPIYQADALIQIEQKKGNYLLSGINKMLPNMIPDVSPDIQLLQSRMVLGKTVDDLQLRNIIHPYYSSGFSRLLARFFSEKAGEITLSSLDIPSRGGLPQTLILTVGENGHYQVQGDYSTDSGVVGQPLVNKDFQVTVSRMSAKPGARFALQQLSQLEAINNIATAFSVAEKSRGSGILALKMMGRDRQLISMILKVISANFLEQNIARQVAQNTKVLTFLKQQLPVVRDELGKAEDKFNAYRRQSDSVDFKLETKSLLDQIVSTDNQLNELTFREAEISQLYKKDHPTYQVLLEKKQQLENKKKAFNKKISTMPAMQQQMLRLSRDVESERQVYMQLLNREQELNIAKSSAIGNVRIIDPAITQPLPVKPKKALIVLVGILFGFFLSSGAVLLVSMLRNGIERPEQLEQNGICVYATVPMSEWLARRMGLKVKSFFSRRIRHKTRDVPFLAIERPNDLAIEAIRGLRTSLQYLIGKSRNKILMITGATPDCGKTFVSSTLTEIMAKVGQKVLYIDGDMRRAYAHNLFSISNVGGLSDVLEGNASAAESVRRFEAGGFDVIPRGKRPANPAELLMNERFSQLLEWADKRYDLVIVDTPPILAVTDATVIGRYAGVNLLVVRHGMNSMSEITTCIQRFRNTGLNIEGAVFNGVVKRGKNAYGYGYHHYGYSYGEEPGCRKR